MDLSVSQSELERLHEAADARGDTVRVNRQALLNILMDHARMVSALKERGVKINEPKPVRHRERI
jgi:alkyl sulfatase BDS1-like metallo-beta-lactamase superfamily hydrolase